MTIEWVDIGKLKPHPKNRNSHSEEQIQRLAELIKYQGWRHPILISNRSGCIVAGHGRLSAAKHLKLQQVPVHYQDFQSDEQEYAFLTSDNAIASWAELDLAAINVDIQELGPDFDIDLLGIKDFVIEPAEKGFTDEDAVPGIPAMAISKPGDLFILGNHRLLVGDATKKEDVERLMNGEKADMVFTDPPYNVDYDYNFADDKRTPDDYLNFISSIFSLCSDIILKPDATMYVKNAPRNLPDFLPIIKSLGWELNNLIVWPHSCQFHPSNRFSTNWEAICAFIRGTHIFNPKAQTQVVDTPLRLKGMKKLDGRIDDVWHDIPWLSAGAMMAKETIRKDDTNSKAHPCQMPIALAERGIVFSSNAGALVYDPFSGSGTTLITCEKTGRKGFGIEIDPVYCDLIVSRWEKFTGKSAVLSS